MDSKYLAVHREILNLREQIIDIRRKLRQLNQDLRNMEYKYQRSATDLTKAQDECRHAFVFNKKTPEDSARLLEAKSNCREGKREMEECVQSKSNISREISALERVLYEKESQKDRLERQQIR